MCNDTYHKEFGIYRYHISQRSSIASHGSLKEISNPETEQDQHNGNIGQLSTNKIMIGKDTTDTYEEGEEDDSDES